MRAAINKQSKNEVKDLLNEYVVSPLNTDISETLTKMEQSIEDLENTTKAVIEKVSAVGGRINNLKSELDKSFHFEDGEDAFEKIKQTVEDSKDEIIQKVDSTYAESTAIKEDVTTLAQSLDSQSKQLASLFTSSVENLNKTVNDNHISTIEGLHQLEEILKSQYDKLKNQSEELSLMVSTEFETSNSKINQFHNETDMTIDNSKAEMQAVIEKKYKTLFIISLSFGITNFLGIISMILLYLIK